MNDTQIFSIALEEVEKICYVIGHYQCGELYGFLGVKKEDDIDKITHTYKEIRSNFNENDEQGKRIIISLDAAYQIISDKRLRDYYDEKMYDVMVEEENKIYNSLKQKNHILLSIIGFSMAPLQLASLIINTSTSPVSSLEILKSFSKKHSALSFSKMILAQTALPSILSLLIQPIFQLKDKIIYPFSTIGIITNEIISYFPSFIITLPVECYMQIGNHHNLSLFQVIKKVVLCQDGLTGKFNFKNLSYTFISSFAMYSFSRVLRYGYTKLEGYIESKSLENPNSTFWRNSPIIKSIYTKSILFSLVLIPYETIHAQYSYLYVQRYLGKSVHSSLSPNPISLTVDLIKSQGYKKLYKSLPFSFFSILLEEYLYSNLGPKP
ncbi:hypothetical protein ACTFIU_003326 [Dictyostelium citrinum]